MEESYSENNIKLMFLSRTTTPGWHNHKKKNQNKTKTKTNHLSSNHKSTSNYRPFWDPAENLSLEATQGSCSQEY